MATVFKVQPALSNGTGNGVVPDDSHIVQQAQLGAQIRGSFVGLWDLEVPAFSLASASKLELVPKVIHTRPNVVRSSLRAGALGRIHGPDVRTRVQAADVEPGGQYHCRTSSIMP